MKCRDGYSAFPLLKVELRLHSSHKNMTECGWVSKSGSGHCTNIQVHFRVHDFCCTDDYQQLNKTTNMKFVYITDNDFEKNSESQLTNYIMSLRFLLCDS